LGRGQRHVACRQVGGVSGPAFLSGNTPLPRTAREALGWPVGPAKGPGRGVLLGGVGELGVGKGDLGEEEGADDHRDGEDDEAELEPPVPPRHVDQGGRPTESGGGGGVFDYIFHGVCFICIRSCDHNRNRNSFLVSMIRTVAGALM